jgi:hypothetical protein
MAIFLILIPLQRAAMFNGLIEAAHEKRTKDTTTTSLSR